MMNSTSKPFISLLTLAGIVLVVGVILYLAGFRLVAQAPPDSQSQARQPGQHQRRQARVEEQPGQAGAEQSAGGEQSGRASKRGGRARGGAVEVRSGKLGTEKIPVIGKGKEQSFTGADLEKLQQTTIASGHGVRAGWRVADVLNQLAITQGTEVVLVAQDGSTLRLPWEKITSHEPTLLLSYNSFGGLMLLSGKEVTPEEIRGLDNQTLKALQKQNRGEATSFMKISKIEVKG